MRLNPHIEEYTACEKNMGRVLSDASSSSADFLFYSGNYCPYCTALKRLLDSKGLTYDEINFNEVDDQVRYDVVQETGHRTVPVVIDNREDIPIFIGGFTETRKYLK